MTTAEVATVLATIRSVWSRWQPSANEIALWGDSLQHWGCATILLAVQRLHASGRVKGFGPTMADLLTVANEVHREESQNAAGGDRDRDYARHAEIARQDLEAAKAVLDEADAATLARAKKWLAEEAIPTGAAGDVETFHVKYHLIPTLLKACPAMGAFMLADAILRRPWERGEGIEALGSPRTGTAWNSEIAGAR
jgi:hypothetical protein